MQGGDLLFVDLADAGVVCAGYRVDEDGDVVLDVVQAVSIRLGSFGAEFVAVGEALTEDVVEEAEDAGGGNGFDEAGDELLFEGVSGDAAKAALGLAAVVRVLLVASLCPAGGELTSAVLAEDETTERKIFAYVVAGEGGECRLEAFQNSLVGRFGDQGLMLSTDTDVPFLADAPASVEGIAQQGLDAVVGERLAA